MPNNNNNTDPAEEILQQIDHREERTQFRQGESLRVQVGNRHIDTICLVNYNTDPLTSIYSQWLLVAYINDAGLYQEDMVRISFVSKH